jgi:hypothetical protein
MHTSYLYSVECASVMHSTYCHHSSVTCLTWKDNILVTGSWDSTVKVTIMLTVYMYVCVWGGVTTWNIVYMLIFCVLLILDLVIGASSRGGL